MKKLLAVAALALISTPASAATSLTHFTFQNVTLDGGGSVTGFFDTDQSLNAITNWSVGTGAGTPPFFLGGTINFPAHGYASGQNGSTATFSGSSVIFSALGEPFGSSLTVSFSGMLGSSTAVTGGAESEFIFSRAVNAGGSIVGSEASVVAPVPEPATWAMMLLGFGAVGGAARYRRRKTDVAFA